MPETKNVKCHQQMNENDEYAYAAAFYEGLYPYMKQQHMYAMSCGLRSF